MKRKVTTAAGLAMLAVSGVAAAQEAEPPTREERRLERWNSPTLTRFRSEAEFRRYLRDFEAVRDGSSRWGPVPPAIVPAPMPVPAPAPAGSSPSSPSAVVQSENFQLSSPTAAAATPDNPDITNVQEAGVDEGGIVKQVGRFLLVLHHARIFSVDLGADGAAPRLADRIDVYRSSGDDAWYDEMLVFGDRVVVTGYSYGQDASQFTVLRLSPEGRLSREGTFFLSSNDYYDEDNYATRLVGDRLVIYAPFAISDAAYEEDDWKWPAIRRWRPEDAQAEQPRPGRPVMDARSIYRPVATSRNPVIHTVSICRLGDAAAASDDLGCESRAFIAGDENEMYVTPSDARLWTHGGSYERDAHRRPACGVDFRPAAAETHPAQLYRMPLAEAGLAVAGVRGAPIDQLSLAAIGDNFHALTRWAPTSCASADEPAALSFATIPLARFSARLREVPESAYVPLPDIGAGTLENRFTDRYLVYGGRSGWSSFPPGERVPEAGRVAVVPVARPTSVRVLGVPHSIIRAERVGEDVVFTGYRGPEGLEPSLLDLTGVPRIASTVRLDARFETEGRSHAFNSRVGADGSGLIGIPTAPRIQEAGRWVWRSGASDLSYLSLDAAGTLAPLAELRRGEGGPRGDYRCEVSCVDWYGNSRPIFTLGRIFALTGTELIEGRLEDGRIVETVRLDLTAPVQR